MVKNLLELFMKKNYKDQSKQIQNRKSKRKGDKLFVKWKGYDNSFNSWIDKKHIV